MLKPLYCAYNPSIHFYRYTSPEVSRKTEARNGSWQLNFSVTAQGKIKLKTIGMVLSTQESLYTALLSPYP